MPANQPVTSLESLRDSVQDLPTIPETLSRILELLEDPNSGARDLGDVIRGDAPLASKVLRLANSPLYQKQRSIGTVQECVSVLGYRTVRQVALCVSVVSTLGHECSARGATLDYRDLWRHGVAVGAVAQELARLAAHPEPADVFSAGLLHDLGKFVLVLQHPRGYSEVVRDRCRQGRRLVDLEREVLGFDHAAAGAVLAEAWNFPATLAVPIAGHHVPEPADRGTALVALADYLGNLLDPATSDLGFDALLVDTRPLYRAAGLERDHVEAHLADLREAIAAASPLRNLH